MLLRGLELDPFPTMKAALREFPSEMAAMVSRWAQNSNLDWLEFGKIIHIYTMCVCV